MKSIDLAQSLATRFGFKVFPLAAGAKAPPLWKDWPNHATTAPSPDSWPAGANVGVDCGGLLVLDVDTHKGGAQSLEWLEISHGALPETLTVSTPSGGQHRIYRLPEGHPGVPNSVEALGRGLDVRGAHGYIVGAGSKTEAGTYRIVKSDAAVQEAPDWLVQLCGVSTERGQREIVDVPHADEAVMARARDWIALRAPAIEGQGGDAHTYATAAMLRDMGVSEGQATLLLAEHWNSRCEPPWDEHELAAKVKHAYRYATGAPGSKAVTAEDFETIEDAPPPKPSKRGKAPLVKALTRGETRPAPYLIKGLLYERHYAMVYGESGIGKTFCVLDMAYHIAAGKPWHGRRVRQGRVLYVGFEAYGSLGNRVKALCQKYENDDVPMHVTPGGFNLRTPEGRDYFREVLAELPEKPKLIVFDTFAYALAGGDENSQQDTGQFHDVVQRLIESTGACVLLIHHPGKDASRGARGSSTIFAAVDTMLYIRRGVIESTKQREVDLAPQIGFKLQTVAIGVDEDGDPITTCAVAAAPVQEATGETLKGNTRNIFDMLCTMSPNNEPVNRDDWREACKDFFEGAGSRKRFSEAVLRLVAMKKIEVKDGMVTRRME